MLSVKKTIENTVKRVAIGLVRDIFSVQKTPK
jgi:hypothetical protein